MRVAFNALARRLSKLQRGRVFSILALDHSLTSGVVKGLEDTILWSRFADKVGLAAIVANYGTARNLPENRKHALVLQMMGAPDLHGKRQSRRVANAVIGEAIRLDADCVSVQVDFTSDDLHETLYDISNIRTQAHELAIPVLFMITQPQPNFRTVQDIANAVKACSELGADLIKVAYDCEIRDNDKSPLFDKQSPAVLLAGGEQNEAFLHNLAAAKQVGFSGYCIGRNIFQSVQPEKVFKEIDTTFRA